MEESEEYVLGLGEEDDEGGGGCGSVNYWTKKELHQRKEEKARLKAEWAAGYLQRRRIKGRLRMQEARAKMTPEDREVFREKDRIRVRMARARRRGEELDYDVLTRPLDETRSTKRKRANMTPAEKEMVREKDSIRVNEIRARIQGEGLNLDCTSGRRRNETIPSSGKKRRAEMTPAEKEMARERDRIRVREARARLTGEGRLIELKRAADAKRLRRQELRNGLNSVENTPNGNVIQGETYQKSPVAAQLSIPDQEMPSDISKYFMSVKDEIIDDIGPDQNQETVNSLNLHGLHEPKSPLTSITQWQYVHIETAEDDQDELNPSDSSDPLSGIHPGYL